MTPVRFFLLALLVACGGRSRQVCPSETHLADPDGRGERCIADESTCDAVADCVSADACCTSTCADPSGGGIYACTQQCRAPDCTFGSCGAGWLCQEAPNDECTAYCVPDTVDCGDGFIPADPTGTGNFVCVHEESACLRPADCPGSADGCCTGYCSEGLEGVWSCTQDCYGDAEPSFVPPDDRDEGAQEWQCTTDEDCEIMMGAPGWTCDDNPCGGTYDCQPPAAECDGDEDCVLALDTSQCCMNCADAYSVDEIALNGCLVVQAQGDPAPPDEGEAIACDAQCYAVECPAIDCMPPNRASCSEGQCVPVY